MAPILAFLLLQRLPDPRHAVGRQARGRLGARPDPARRRRTAAPGRVHPAQGGRGPAVGARSPSTAPARWSTSRAAHTPTTSAPARTGPGTGSTARTARGRASTPRSRSSRRRRRSGCAGPAAGGDTTAGGPLDSNSPTSPGSRPHWKDPLALIEKATPTKAAPAAPPPPKATVSRTADTHTVTFEAPPEATALVVATRPRGSDDPAKVTTIDLAAATGTVEIPAQSEDDEVWTSVVAPGRGPSDAV